MHAPTLTLSLEADRCLHVANDIGCAIRVVDGELWVTVDGQDRDFIARRGERLVLERNARALVSPFRSATIAVSARCGTSEVGFLLQEHDSSRMLTVTAPSADTLGSLGRWLAWGGAPVPRPLQAETPLV